MLIFLLGLVWGSFSNVCIHRLPRDESLWWPPSHCPTCTAPIPWWGNIPLLSYVLLGGRCRDCRRRISPRYPLVELLTGVLFLGVYLRCGRQWSTVAYLVFVALLVPVIFIDLTHQIIPDCFSLGGTVLGFGAALAGLLPLSWSDSLLGILAGGGSLWLIAAGYYRLTGREGMGGGDIKLLAMIGAFLGWRSLLPVVLVSSFTGAMVGLALMAAGGRGRHFAIPFGPFLALGALVYLFWGDELVRTYLLLVGARG